jgi:hypothetical protein
MPKIGVGRLVLLACALGLSATARADCPPHSHPYDTTEEGHVTTVHCECDGGYIRTPGGCSPSVAPKAKRSALPSRPRVDCAAAKQRAEQLRASVEQIRQTAERNQEELADWTKMNDEAQKAAIAAAVRFAMASYTADIEKVNRSTKKAERAAAELMKKYGRSRKQATRLRYLAQLRNALAEATPVRAMLITKRGVQLAQDADQTWTVARNTMQNEFRVAANHDANIKEILQDPGFRDAFTGDPAEEPGMEVLTSLWDEAVEDSVKVLSTAGRYEALGGSAVRAGVFVRDAAYAALESLLSTQRVSQDADAAGALAKAAGVWQKQYQTAVNDLRTCVPR